MFLRVCFWYATILQILDRFLQRILKYKFKEFSILHQQEQSDSGECLGMRFSNFFFEIMTQSKTSILYGPQYTQAQHIMAKTQASWNNTFTGYERWVYLSCSRCDKGSMWLKQSERKVIGNELRGIKEARSWKFLQAILSKWWEASEGFLWRRDIGWLGFNRIILTAGSWIDGKGPNIESGDQLAGYSKNGGEKWWR